MNLGNDQRIEGINQSSITQAQNITYNGVSVDQVYAIINHVLEDKLSAFSLEADIKARKRQEEITDKIIERIKSEGEDLFQRFIEPSIQLAVKETQLSYIVSGDDELEEDLIDLLIERLKVKDRTTEQSIIDEARGIIPSLTSNTLAILTIIVFSKTIFPFTLRKYNDSLIKLGSCVAQLRQVGSLDIAHLKQMRCGYGIPVFEVSDPLEIQLSKTYDLLFRKEIRWHDLSSVYDRFPDLTNIQQVDNIKLIADMYICDNEHLRFNVGSSKIITSTLQKNGKAELLPLFEDLKEQATPFTIDEIMEYHLQKDPNWKYAFDLFRSNDIRTLQLTPVGVYIGIRKLSKICKVKIPLSLFYPD